MVVVAIAALVTLLGASCKQLDPNNRAAVVPGVTNGSLPMAYLASTASGCVAYDESINSLNAMIAQAAKDGVTLRPISCYRDYAGQVAAREEWCARGACQMAAVPGTSNHGWGKAIDFRDQSGELTFDSAGYAWLKAWAGYYGWIHPKGMEQDGPVPEAWHWEWIGDGGKMFLGEYFGIGNGPLATPRGLPFGNLDSVIVSADTPLGRRVGDRPRPGRVDPRARVHRRCRDGRHGRPAGPTSTPPSPSTPGRSTASTPRSPSPPGSTRCARTPSTSPAPAST